MKLGLGAHRPSGSPAPAAGRLAVLAWAACALPAGAQAWRLRAGASALLAASQHGGHPPVEGQRVGAHRAHAPHGHGNRSHGGKQHRHGHGPADGALRRWGSAHNDTGAALSHARLQRKPQGHKHPQQNTAPEAAREPAAGLAHASAAPKALSAGAAPQHGRRENTSGNAPKAVPASQAARGAKAIGSVANHSALPSLNSSSSPLGENSSSSLSNEVRSLLRGVCLGSDSLCHGAEAAGWDCSEQCQGKMEGCAARRGSAYSKCRAEVEEAHGITWGRWMDPSRHRRNTTFNATALTAVEVDEASLDSPRGRPRPGGPVQPLRAAAAAADDDD